MEAKKAYIVEHVNRLSLEDRIQVLSIILFSDSSIAPKIKRKMDGSEIAMDQLSPETINNIYSMIKEKMKQL